MNRRTLFVTAAILAVLLAGEGAAFARGGGRGGASGGQRLQTQAQGSSQLRTCVSDPAAQLRPADSRRRDGTFMTTGTTANGSTTRPGNGRGAMDGTGCTTTTATE